MFRKSELLAAVYERLSDPKRWVKGMSARTALGYCTSPTGPDAVSWCLTGAVRRELHDHGYQVDHLTSEMYRDLEDEFYAQHPFLYPRRCGPVQLYNDHPEITHEGLLAVLEKVHAKLVERGE